MAGTTDISVLQLAEQLSAGFEALSGDYQTLFDQQRQLETKLSWAKQQYLDLLKRYRPDTLSQDHRAFLEDLEHTPADQSQSPLDVIERTSHSDDADRSGRAALIRQAVAAAEILRTPTTDASGVKIWSGPLADKQLPALRIQPNLEKDFTTAGTPSRLGCPFALNQRISSPLATPRSSVSHISLKGRRSKRPSFCDPIRAEVCGNDTACVSASASPSIEGSAAVCPIRFLDQHAPEEVAKYFEKHKHELPRSHEMCIGRFQTNTESIKQLDRKYGNLVSMIQGLGEKHQAWLPEEPEDDANLPADKAEPDLKVENWATAVTTSLQGCTPDEEDPPEQDADEGRTTHFDRPMKEIRVGESPSRPWGISIPAKYTNADSSSSVGSVPTASPPLPLETSLPFDATPKKSGQCPFGHLVKTDGSKVQEHEPVVGLLEVPDVDIPVSSLEQPTESDPPQPDRREKPAEQRDFDQNAAATPMPQVVPQMVFNGPVFIGYPPDQLAALLQNSNFGGAMR